MADRRYRGGIWQGNPQPRSARIEARLQLPTTWGWQLTGERIHGYSLWIKGDMLMVRSDGLRELPAGWIVQIGETTFVYDLVTSIGAVTSDVEKRIAKC